MRHHRRAIGLADIEDQPVFRHARDAARRRRPADRPAGTSSPRSGRRSRPRARARYRDPNVRSIPRRASPPRASMRMARVGHRRFSRIATERACASSPSASPSAIAAGAERRKLIGAAFQDRGALDEIEHAEARREARRARGRQHVVRAADIIADRFRRIGSRQRSPRHCGSCRSGFRDRRRSVRDARAPAHRPAARPRRDRAPGWWRRNRARRRRRFSRAAASSTARRPPLRRRRPAAHRR